jgi:hypothetical protein
MTGDFPQYSYPGGMVAGLAFDFLFRRAHSFQEDGIACADVVKAEICKFWEEKIFRKRARVSSHSITITVPVSMPGGWRWRLGRRCRRKSIL